MFFDGGAHLEIETVVHVQHIRVINVQPPSRDEDAW
jgi:hypothetical protein